MKQMLSLPDPSTIVLLVLVSLIYWWGSRAGTFWMVLLRFPSTLIHELAHLLIALITLARPGSVSIFPKRTSDGCWILGSVECKRISRFNAFPVGMAPALVNLPFALWTYQWGSTEGYLLSMLLVTAAVPSLQDMKIAVSSFTGFALWITTLLVLGGRMSWF